jgi:hypothetical protein
MAKQVESAVTQSRGENALNYMPALKKGAQIMSASIGGLFLSGSIVSGKKTIAITHGIGRKPKFISVCALATLAQVSGLSSTSGIGKNVPVIAVAAASAATTAVFYVIGGQTQNTALKYSAYLQW